MWFSFHFLFKDKRFYKLLKDSTGTNFFSVEDYIYLSKLIRNSNITTILIICSYFFWLFLNVKYLETNWVIYFSFIGVSFIVRLIVPFLGCICICLELRLKEREYEQFITNQIHKCSLKKSSNILFKLDESVDNILIDWQLLFVANVLFPLVTFILQTYNMYFDKGMIYIYISEISFYIITTIIYLINISQLINYYRFY
jgi:hypothetical protein